MKEQNDKASAGEAPTAFQPAVLTELAYQAINERIAEISGEVVQLHRRIMLLNGERDDLLKALRKAGWTRPEDVPIKTPYKSDIAVGCVECGKPTKWRIGGKAIHHPECPPDLRVVGGARRIVVSDEAWKILLDEEVE